LEHCLGESELSELIAAAGLAVDALAGRAYLCTDETAFLVPICEVSTFTQPMLERAKLERILLAILGCVPLPPIRLQHRCLLRDGHHRLAVSRALGAAEVPCTYSREE
jgi:hypothetical protein